MKNFLKYFVKAAITASGYDLTISRRKEDVAIYQQQYGHDSVAKKRFYNINGGGHFNFGGGLEHPCWTNIDIQRTTDSKISEDDIIHDLLDLSPLPIESNTAELVHSQYTIEHITDDAAGIMFKEVHRILKSKGVFRVVVPNNELDYIAYLNNDRSFFYWENFFNYRIPLNKASLEQIFLVHFAANASVIHPDPAPNPITDEEFRHFFLENNFTDAMNMCIARCSVEKQKLYRYNHINWWTHNKLSTMLQEAGFTMSYILAPGQSSTSVMRNRTYFDSHWNDVALFMEAIKD